jgi:CIC family chloride channel protein
MALLNSRVTRLAAASLAAGTMIGLIGAVFRFCLVRGDRLRDALVYWAHSWPHAGWIRQSWWARSRPDWPAF